VPQPRRPVEESSGESPPSEPDEEAKPSPEGLEGTGPPAARPGSRRKASTPTSSPKDTAQELPAAGPRPAPREGGPPPADPSTTHPTTKESFDELAKRVARAEPRRGSIVQPPPAWEPDEVTLGFAVISEKSGEVHELSEPTLLATILIAVETDRRRILNRMAASFEEEVDAVANLFWPFVIVQGGPGGGTAIFDGTGVWKRTFRYTRMPSMEGVQPLLDRTRLPSDYLTRMRALAPHFGRDAGGEVLTVEGFLPLDPPLLFDVLSQSQFRSDPQSPHAGFLPARHKIEWYHDEVGQMRQWLERFENDLKALAEIRGKIEAIVKENQTRLEEEYRKLEEQARARAENAASHSDEEVAAISQSHHAEVARNLEAMRKAQAAVAHSEVAISTSDTLAFRAGHRRADASPHQARSRQAQGAIRAANRQIGESRRAIERIHERQRAALEQAVSKVLEVEKENAKLLGDHELFRDDYAAASLDLLQSIDGQLAARSMQKNLLAGYFLPLPSLASVRVVWFPIWMATLRSSRGVRQIVFPPMQVRAAMGIGGTLKRLFGGIVLPLEPRTAQFDKVLRPTMEEALARDPWLSTVTQELTRAADVLVDPDVLQRLQVGLGELRRDGWISQKQETDFLQAYSDRLRRRTAHGTSTAGPVPTGARTEGFRPETTGPPPSAGSG